MRCARGFLCALAFTLVLVGIFEAPAATGQKLAYEGRPLQLVRLIDQDTSGSQVFFFEDGNDPDTNLPMPPPSERLAPITDEKEINFLSQQGTIPGKTLKNVVIVDIYLRQRYFYRNDGQNVFRARTYPILELESAALEGLVNPSTGSPLNGIETRRLPVMHLDAKKTLAQIGEDGRDSRGNRHSVVITVESFDWYGSGVGKRVFDNDLIVRVLLENTVQGLHHFVVGTRIRVFGN